MAKLVIDEARYGSKKGTRRESYWPHGTREQAENVATSLSYDEAGCTDYWIIEDERPAAL